MTTLVRESGLYSGSTFTVLVELADEAAHDGSGSRPSVETVAEYCRLSVRQAQRCIAELEETGVITREILGAGRGLRASWRLNVEMLTAARDLADLEGRRRARREDRKKVTSASPFLRRQKPVDKLVEKVTSGGGKGDVQSAERVTSGANSGSASILHDPKHFDPRNGSAQTGDKSPSQIRSRKCTHSNCGPDGCRYEFERVDFNRVLEQVEMRAAIARGK